GLATFPVVRGSDCRLPRGDGSHWMDSIRAVRARCHLGTAPEFGDRMTEVDWGWKLREAIDRIKTAYAHIGRSSGAPILAIVYPPEQEIAVFKEWHTLLASLSGSYEVRTVDALDTTMRVIDEFGVETIVSTLAEPMPGSDPRAELGRQWV